MRSSDVVHFSQVTAERFGQLAIFFVPGLGGRAASFELLGGILGSDYLCYGLEFPGFDGAIAPLESIEQIAQQLCQRITGIVGEAPVALVGYSVGGVIAFEMARLLEQENRRVGPLVLIDSAPPSQMRHRSGKEIAEVWRRFLLDRSSPNRLQTAAHGLRRAVEKMREPRIRTSSPKLGLEDPRRQSEVYEGDAMTALWRTMFVASRAYRATAFQRDLLLVRSTLGVRLAYRPEEFYAEWDDLTGGRVSTRVVRGCHLDLLKPPAVHDIAACLQQAFENHAV